MAAWATAAGAGVVLLAVLARWGRCRCDRDHTAVSEISLRLATAGIIVIALTGAMWAVGAWWPDGGLPRAPEAAPRGRYWWEAV